MTVAFNGSGLFNIDSTGQPVSANTLIESADFNALTADLATGLSNCITKDGQQTVTANLPMATYRHTGVGNAVARTDYAAAGQVQDGKLNWVDGGGTADAITATYSPAITALVNGQLCCVRATAANATTTPTFAPNGLTARTIVKKGGSALAVGDISADGHELILRYDLTNTQWELLNPAPASLAANTFTGVQRWAKGADVASANALTLGTDGNYFDITGTTAITSIGTLGVGTVVKLHFDGALTLTHHATDLILPGAVNITTAAGDEIELVEYATGDWRMVGGVKADGTAWVVAASGITLDSPITMATGSPAIIEISTSIPAGTKRIDIGVAGGSTNSTSNWLIQIGDSGGFETTGYSSGATNDNGTRVTNTAGFIVTNAEAAALSWSGIITLLLIDSANNTWVGSGHLTDVGSGADSESGGHKSLSGELTSIRLTTVGGTAKFDAGTLAIQYS